MAGHVVNIRHATKYQWIARRATPKPRARRGASALSPLHAEASEWVAPTTPSWEQFVEEHHIRPIEPFPAALGRNGLLPRLVSKVNQRWRPLLAEVVATYKRHCGARLIGVYLRGSLAKGTEVCGLSDVDTFALYLVPGGRQAEQAGAPGLQQLEAEILSSLASSDCPQWQKVKGSWLTKVEVKLMPVQADRPLGRLLASYMSAPAAAAASLPPSLARQVPHAWELHSGSATLAGLDLPGMLPDVAGLPRLQLLPELPQDVGRAGSAAREALQGGDASAAGRAARWALKRCIRGALELVVQQCGYHSRDLYWCVKAAAEHLPQLQQLLQQALALYLQLAVADKGSSSSSSSSSSTDAAAVAQALHLAAALSSQLDDLLLERMLVPEPSWLLQHRPPSAPATPTQAAAAAAAPPAAAGTASLFRKLAALVLGADRGASSDGGGRYHTSQLAGCPPPAVQIPIAGPVAELDWAQAWQTSQQYSGSGGSGGGSSSSSSSLASQLLCCMVQCTGPVVLRGAAAAWPALARWDLDYLARQPFRGKVKVAPSLQFPFCEPQLLRYLLATEKAGRRAAAAAGVGGQKHTSNLVTAAPSVEVEMSVTEFAERLRCDSALPALVYPPGEFYYMQAELAGRLQLDAPVQSWLQQLQQLLLQAASCADCCSDDGRRPITGSTGSSPAAASVQLAQSARVWISPQGAVSPLHYDTSASFLAQIRGTKRMLLVHPDQLECLYPYPDVHLLRRRSRVNVVAPDSGSFPLFERVAAQEVVLRPGDVLFFPQHWAHHTESCELSVSVTFRVEELL